MSKSTTKQCSVEGCEKPHYAKSFCHRHYRRLRKTGSLEEKVSSSLVRDDQGRKRCTCCKEWLEETEFYNSTGSLDGKSTYCISCNKDSALQSKYGITLEQFQQMLQNQGNVCGICKETFKSDRDTHVDHDHACCPGKKSCGSCVRQLLCRGCNHGLGHFQDNPALLLAAVEYLQRNKR